MKQHVLKTGICFAIVLAILSGCTGRTEQSKNDAETETKLDNTSLVKEEKEETPQGASAPSTGITGDTPEEIIRIFMDAFEQQDVNTMLSCCYIDEMASRYSFAENIDRIHAFVPTNYGPVNSQFYRELMRSERKGEFARNIRFFTWSILLAEDEDWLDDSHGLKFYTPKANVDYDWAKEFEKKVDIEQIHGLKVLSIDESRPELQNRDDVRHNFSELSRMYGVDELRERTVLFECNGKLFYKGFTLAQYDGQWQIQSLNVALLPEDTYGIATLIESEDDYWDTIA